MRLLPERDETFDSPLPPLDVTARLRASVEPGFRLIRWGPSRRPFEGEVGDQTFRIRRRIEYGNGWRPELRGVIEPGAAGGSRVRVRFVLARVTARLAVVWMGFAAFLGLGFAWGAWRDGRAARSDLLPWAMLAAFYALMTAAFSFEAAQSRRALRALLTGPSEAASGVRSPAA